jgi:hypothetical protein
MHTDNPVLALFRDVEDEAQAAEFMAQVPDVIRILTGDNPASSLEYLKMIGIHPRLAIASSRLYPAERPDLVRLLRKIFPEAEILLISSDTDPSPSLQPLAADKVRHLVINPASREKAAVQRHSLAALKKLVTGGQWELCEYLKPDARIRTCRISSSTQKEELIAMVESAIAGSSPEIDLLRQRGALLVDEMLENAVYNAPRRDDGSKLFRKGEIRSIAPHEGIIFRFGFDGETLAMEMVDNWGSLSPDVVLHYLARNQAQEGEGDETGGRGLFIIWRILDHLHVTITPGRQTVIGGHLKATSTMDLDTPRGFNISTGIC